MDGPVDGSVDASTSDDTRAPALSGAFVTPERLRLAEAVRHLIDAVLTAEDATEEELAGAAAQAQQLAARLSGAAAGVRRLGAAGYSGRNHDDYLPRSPLVGEVNPMAPPIAYDYRDGRLYGRGIFHAAYEGPPGYVHGGWVALAFDEILGMANIASGHPGMTGRLSVRYRRPTPLHREVRFEGWTDQVQGRRIVAKGTLEVDGEIAAEADGLFVVIGPERAAEYFGPQGPDGFEHA